MSVTQKQLRSIATRCMFNPNKPKTPVETVMAETKNVSYLILRSIENMQLAAESPFGTPPEQRIHLIEQSITLLLLAVANAENRKNSGDGRLSGQRPSGEDNPDTSGRQT